MKKTRRFTIVVLLVAVLLAATGVALFVFLPSQMMGRAEDALATRAKGAAEYLASYAAAGISRRDYASVRRATELARMEQDLVYAVVVDEGGTILASATEDIAAGDEWTAHVDSLAALDLEEVTSAIVRDEKLVGDVHVGLSRAATLAGVEKDKKVLMGFSAFLILLALGTGFGVVQMERLRSTAEEWQQRHKSVRLQAGTLYSSVREHRENERSLKESESKYKSLFESTMASAMADLEELNSHLEKRKADLEHEVGVRKKAEQALRRYTKRLQLLNTVERSLLEGAEVQESATLALSNMAELVPSTRLWLIEIDERRGSAHVLGMEAEVDNGQKVGDSIPYGAVKKHNDIVHEGDLAAKEELTETERVLMAQGTLSYVNVPLVVQEEVVGMLCLESGEARAFGEEHFSIARDVADLMAIGIHRARLDEERELYEEELILARDRAEDMARLKTAFLTNMSHEIRTPISGIMGFAQVLHEEVPEALREFTGLIRESAHRLLNTINSVLELARLESGKMAIEVMAMDLVEETQKAAGLLESAARRKGLSFRFEGAGTTAWCNLDRACVERIVTNLIDNAIKFTDGGGVRVSVDTEDGYARLVVADTGVGIAEDFVHRLFDEFRQEQMAADREHEGSGLGLAITKKLVDRLGGTINVQSKKGVGTAVTVLFPLIEQAEGKEAMPVMVVTGNPDAANLIQQVLGSAFMCEIAETPRDAVYRATEADFEAIIVDVNSAAPQVVEEAARRLARVVGPQRLLALASQIVPQDTERLLRTGFSQFVQDPFRPGVLAKALAEPREGTGVTPAATPSGDRPAVRNERESWPGSNLGQERV